MGANHKTTRASHKALQAFRAECAEQNLACWLCRQEIDYEAPHDDYSNPSRFQRDHRLPVSTHPQFAEDPTNWEPSHAGCNNERKNKPPRPPIGKSTREWT